MLTRHALHQVIINAAVAATLFLAAPAAAPVKAQDQTEVAPVGDGEGEVQSPLELAFTAQVFMPFAASASDQAEQADNQVQGQYTMLFKDETITVMRAEQHDGQPRSYVVLFNDDMVTASSTSSTAADVTLQASGTAVQMPDSALQGDMSVQASDLDGNGTTDIMQFDAPIIK